MTKALRNFSGRFLFVGCGNMAGAMLDRWLAAGLDPALVAIVDPYAAPRAGIVQHASLDEWQAAGGSADWIMLGMKPQQLGDVADVLAPLATGKVHLLSILAGVSLADLAARFPHAGAQVRILPNLAARIGAGVSAVATLGDADDAAIDALLDTLGQTVRLADDSTMDLVTAFTGSGPAFVFRLIESYAAAGERLGLSAEDALALATATFGGATALLADSGEKPGVLIAQVASKGGTTQAGLDVLDSDGQLAALLTNVLRAARDRGRELADIARGEG
ncbi:MULTISPECIES: pyrroline-5-carboxylate reductase [unclassified Sphingopyxis]|uniref:pyrroline-5-carboxylate reductase n=1 Tax=unclassified Sphingopyxis TaxID=2614943 RepID=UPI00286330FD|nr:MULTISPECIES: pyrroline-5-carboxylate reductase [unclassified Sphingopyxis]MDR7058807.1 pyrroline-5-carboxylate reductase [Sphingopyxis sp. BE235]MDR7179007.1 pyrroline-5-carboxylate reductase [Sphingopyxis sp. BE249]